MVETSFRSWTPRRVYPALRRWKLGALPLFGAVGILFAGCGGDGGQEPVETLQTVRASGYRFQAPAGWVVTRSSREVGASPDEGSDTRVSVHVFRLLRPFRPALWPRVVPELDKVATKLAAGLRGTVDARRTIQAGGGRARQYEVFYEREGRELKQQLTFVLRARTEYELVCRWPTSAGEPEACATLVSSFRPA